MAQVCGGTTFDLAASHKHDAAHKVLSRAADLWAMHGREAVSLDAVLAVLLRIFLARWSDFGGLRQEARSLELWLPRVGTPQQEAEARIPAAATSTIPELLAHIHTELSFALEQWLLGDPEQPPTAHALNCVEHILFTHRLSHRPANPKLPTNLSNA